MIVETVRPRARSSGMIRVTSVVLPLFFQPTMPTVCMRCLLSAQQGASAPRRGQITLAGHIVLKIELSQLGIDVGELRLSVCPSLTNSIAFRIEALKLLLELIHEVQRRH